MTPKLAVAVGVLIVFAAAIAAAEVIDASRSDSNGETVARHDESRAESQGFHATNCAPEKAACKPNEMPPATAGLQPGEVGGGGDPLKPGAAASWAQLEASLPAQIGLAVTTVGSDSPPSTFGPLQSGHAWSSIKVPILATLINQREGEDGELSSEEKALARSALTASDNTAAASLFAAIEATYGGLEGASRAVSETLNGVSAIPTEVATAPPPSGAASRYGQTGWSLSASAEFFAALDQGCVVREPSGTEEVLALMGEVVPEQQWGLAAAEFPAGTALAYKAGWGPEGSASGPYLVRQGGIVHGGGGGAVAVAMMAIDEGGSFEAGVADLGQIAQWLAENLKSPLPVGGSAC